MSNWLWRFVFICFLQNQNSGPNLKKDKNNPLESWDSGGFLIAGGYLVPSASEL